MIGAIAGDIIGIVYASHSLKRTALTRFGPWCDFTDDTALTEAVADAITIIPLPVLEFWRSEGLGSPLFRDLGHSLGEVVP